MAGAVPVEEMSDACAVQGRMQRADGIERFRSERGDGGDVHVDDLCSFPVWEFATGRAGRQGGWRGPGTLFVGCRCMFGGEVADE